MMEWSGDHTTMELVNMQAELCRWRRIRPLDSVRSVLSVRASLLSEQVLAMSGLIPADQAPHG
jgi:hypothetical protein